MLASASSKGGSHKEVREMITHCEGNAKVSSPESNGRGAVLTHPAKARALARCCCMRSPGEGRTGCLLVVFFRFLRCLRAVADTGGIESPPRSKSSLSTNAARSWSVIGVVSCGGSCPAVCSVGVARAVCASTACKPLGSPYACGVAVHKCGEDCNHARF